MIVMKFGGTSVQDAAAIRTVCDIVSRETGRNPLVVVSACAGVTNELIECSHSAAKGSVDKALDLIVSLEHRHKNIASELLSEQASGVDTIFTQQFRALEALVRGIDTRGSIDSRTIDSISVHGELWSSTLLAAALKERGVQVDLVDARSVMITDDETPANPIPNRIAANADSVLRPRLESGHLVVTQGFIGSTSDGRATTLGRGGSDYSASLFGAALGSEEIQIWTDVDGILTADPSIVPGARQIREMSFQEASELAYFGARVLHPGTILPAVSKGIPVRVLNSKSPGEGTLITDRKGNSRNGIVKSIAYKEGITTVTLRSTRKLMNYGFLARVFAVFEKHKKSIDVVATSEVGVSLTVDNRSDLEKITEELSNLAEVHVEQEKAVLCIVGENIKRAGGIAGRVFQSLRDADVNIELISLGGSEINLTFVIAEAQIEAAVKALHREFFPGIGSHKRSHVTMDLDEE